MAAFANSEGGVLFLGVADADSLPGLSRADVSRLNQMISNVATPHVRSPLTVHTANVELENGRLVIALIVPRGIDTLYFDRSGVIWLKSAADKRRVNSTVERFIYPHGMLCFTTRALCGRDRLRYHTLYGTPDTFSAASLGLESAA
jgi:predicted HTH transcriptional regulator